MVEITEQYKRNEEMSFFDHLDELRTRLIQCLISVFICSCLSFIFVKQIVLLLETPSQSIKFLQVAPGEFLFVSIKVAGYSGLAFSLPFISYQVLRFIIPGLSNREKRLIIPAVIVSTLLFGVGIWFGWWALIPASLKFLIYYGSDVVEPLWSIEKYLDFVLLLLLSTGIAFQLPILQLILGGFGLINSQKMLKSWRWVVISSTIAGAVLTPSTDPITMSILASALTILFFSGVAAVYLIELFKGQTHL